MSSSSDGSAIPLPFVAPAEWSAKPLQAVCRLITDGDWIELKDQGGRDFRLLQISNIGLGEFVETENYRWITEETFHRLRCTEINVGDVLVARMPEPTGRCWYVKELPWRAVTAVDVAIVRTDQSELDGRFLSYYLNSPQCLAVVASLTTGTTRLRIRRADIGRLTIPLPPLSEQRAIAEVLGALDDKIEANRRIVGLCEKLAVTLASLRPPKIALNAVARHLHEMVSPSALGEDGVEHFSLPAFDSGGLPMRTAGSSIKSGKFKLVSPA